MAVPGFLASSHYYKRDIGVVDVQTIIDSISTLLKVTTVPHWTEPVAGTFKSPVDANGRWFSVTPTRVAAKNLDVEVKDKNGVMVSGRRLQIDAGATDVQYMVGENHFYLQALRAVPENIKASMVDMSPESQLAHNGYMAAYGSRDRGDGFDAGASPWCTFHTIDLNGGAYVAGTRILHPSWNLDYGVVNPLSASGAYLFAPAMVIGNNAAAVKSVFGRLYQTLVCSLNLSPGMLYTVPIDVGVTAQFVCLGPTLAGQPGHLLVRAD